MVHYVRRATETIPPPTTDSLGPWRSQGTPLHRRRGGEGADWAYTTRAVRWDDALQNRSHSGENRRYHLRPIANNSNSLSRSKIRQPQPFDLNPNSRTAVAHFWSSAVMRFSRRLTAAVSADSAALLQLLNGIVVALREFLDLW